MHLFTFRLRFHPNHLGKLTPNPFVTRGWKGADGREGKGEIKGRGWTGVDMSTPLLSEVVPGVDANPVNF